jgi:hypothetical protein
MMFYNGFNLMLDVVLGALIARLAYGFGFKAGYSERDMEIENEREVWQDYYYEAQREMRD